MSTANPNKLKVKDIITVVLLALINVVIFFASSVLYATAHYHHSDAGIFRPAGGHRLLHHRHESEKARCDPDLQYRPCHYGRISAVHHPLYSLRCHCRAAAAEDGLRQCEGSDRQLCHHIRCWPHSAALSFPMRLPPKLWRIRWSPMAVRTPSLPASQMLQSWVSVALVAGVIVAAFIGAMIGQADREKSILLRNAVERSSP